jgi:hypothetical protein
LEIVLYMCCGLDWIGFLFDAKVCRKAAFKHVFSLATMITIQFPYNTINATRAF